MKAKKQEVHRWKAFARKMHEAEFDDYLDTLERTLTDGTRVMVNPKYQKAPFELGFVCETGLLDGVWPYRFATQKKSNAYFAAKNADIRAYAVPFFLVITPDGKHYQSW